MVEADLYSDMVECSLCMREVMSLILLGQSLFIWMFFSFPITFGGQFGGGSLEACRGEASAVLIFCHLSLRDICIGMNAYKYLVMKERGV